MLIHVMLYFSPSLLLSAFGLVPALVHVHSVLHQQTEGKDAKLKQKYLS